MVHLMIIGRYLRGPQVGQSELHLTHPGQYGWCGINSRARQSLIIVGVSRGPKRFATRKPKAVESSSGGQGFRLRHREPTPAYHIVDIDEPLLTALEDNPLGQLAADALNLGESKPDREIAITTMFQRSIRSRPYERPYLELNALQAVVKSSWAAATN